MASVDSRIVTMKFDNKEFIQGVGPTIAAFQKLKGSMGFKGSADELNGLQDGVNKFSMNPLKVAVDGTSAAFIALSSIAISALANITNRVIDTGLQMAKSLAIEPITEGFAEYELKMGSIQTIMAGSGASLDVVNKKLEELNTYSDRTIYSFADMTTNIGKFTNAGVDLDTAVASIQGIANVAAVSGANAGEASRAMYNFAQALSKGYVQLIDWKSIELANMGTVEFKQQLIDAAEAQGMLTKQGEGWVTQAGTLVTATQGFNESLTDAWLTTDVLNQTLGDYADESTEIGKKAFAAAQDVKTFSQLMDTLKEAVGSGWAYTFEILIGDFNEAKELWTNVNNVVGGWIGKQSEVRNTLLQNFKDLGGRTVIIDSLKDVFYSLGRVLTAVSDAFRDVFPRKTAGELMGLALSFQQFARRLRENVTYIFHFRKALRGVFAVFSIVWQVVKGVASVIGKLFGAVFQGTGSFIKLAGGVGEFLYQLDKSLKEGAKIQTFFDNLGDILRAPVEFIVALGTALMDLISGPFSSVSSSFGNISDAASPLENLATNLKSTFEGLKETLSGLFKFFEPVLSFLGNLASALGEAIANAFSNADASTIFKALNTGIFAVLTAFFGKLVTGGIGVEFGGGFLDGIGDALEGLSGVLQGMQANLKANALLKIAGAIAILALALLILAGIDPAKLTAAIVAMSASFGILIGGLGGLLKVVGGTKTVQLQVAAATLVTLSIAILILSAALKNLSSLSWGEIAKGLVGLAGGLAILVKALDPLKGSKGGMIKAAFSLIILALAVRTMAGALEKMGSIALGDLAKGLGGAALAMVILTKTINRIPIKDSLSAAAAILVLSGALLVMSFAVERFAAIPFGDILKGLGGVALTLIVVGNAMKLMPKNMLVTAAGLVVVGIALNIIAKALESIGSLSITELLKGLLGLAVGLGVIAVALILMNGTIGGAIALAIAAASISLLTIALKALGQLSIAQIVTALVTLAAVFVVLGAAAYLLTPLIPSLLALGIALLLIGAAMALAGAGVLAFSIAFTIFAAALRVGTDLVVGAISKMIDLIPQLAVKVAEGFIAFIQKIGEARQELQQAFVDIVGGAIDALIELVPKIGELISTLLDEFERVTREHFPQIVQLGLDMLIEFLNGVDDALPEIIERGVNIIIKFIYGVGLMYRRILDAGTTVIIMFIRGVGQNAQRLVNAGFQTILDFINAMTDAVNRYMPQIREASRRLAFAIIDGMTGGLASKAYAVYNKLKDIARGALDAAKRFLGINSPSKVFMGVGESIPEGMVLGIRNTSDTVGEATEEMGKVAVDNVKSSMKKMYDAVDGEVNVNPVISPVLDLSSVRKEAKSLGTVFGTQPIKADVSYSSAKTISDATLESRERVAAQTEEITKPTVEFTQNNYSPKALSTIEIYRNTRNQLSLAKEAIS